jgi:hypothetical protein
MRSGDDTSTAERYSSREGHRNSQNDPLRLDCSCIFHDQDIKGLSTKL